MTRMRFIFALGILAASSAQTPVARAGEERSVCTKPPSAEAKLVEGDYSGTFSTQLKGSGKSAKVRASISGTVNLTAEKSGQLSATGPVEFSLTIGLELPSASDASAGMNSSATGSLEAAGGATDSFRMKGTLAGGAAVHATAKTAKGGSGGGASDEFAANFKVDAATCNTAQGTFTSDFVDRIVSSFAAQGVTVSVSSPPTWSVKANDDHMADAIRKTRKDAFDASNVSNHLDGLNKLGAKFDEIKDGSKSDAEKTCLLDVVKDVMLLRIKQWEPEDVAKIAALPSDLDVVAEKAMFVPFVTSILSYEHVLGCTGEADGPASKRTRPAMAKIREMVHVHCQAKAFSTARDLAIFIGTLAGAPDDPMMIDAGVEISTASAAAAPARDSQLK